MSNIKLDEVVEGFTSLEAGDEIEMIGICANKENAKVAKQIKLGKYILEVNPENPNELIGKKQNDS